MPSKDTQRRTRNTRRQVLAAMGGAGAAALAGCGDVFDEDADPDVNDFTASLGAEPDDFDPTVINDATSNSAVGTMCYETLLDHDFDLEEFQPALATDWELLEEEPTTWRFELRDGVEYHHGEELVAEDVAFSIERMRGTVNTATVAAIEAVDVVDDLEVEIRWVGPYAPALTDVSGIPIVPHGHEDISEAPAEDDHSFDEESIGTGPWVLESYDPEDRVELSPFDGYWHDEENPWDSVTLRIIPEQVSQEEAMRAGELDMIDNPAPFDLDQWDGEDADPLVDDAVGFDFITFPVNVEPYTNEKFRRGMTRLIPRDDIVEAIFGGNATPLAGPISPGLGTYWDVEHEQELSDEFVGEDPEEGVRLMEEALEEEGFDDDDLPIEVEFITNVNRTRERWMEEIQARMDDLDFIDADLDVQDFDALVNFLLDPDGAAQSVDIVGIGWTGGSDPDGHVESLLHSDFHVPDGFNWNLYENEAVDRLIDAGQTTIDIDERVQVYRDLQEVLAEDVPAAYMWTGDQIDVVNTVRVDGWEPYPNSSFRYWALYRPSVGVVARPT